MSDVAQENSPLLNAIGLKKYYPVKKGMFAKTQQVKALDFFHRIIFFQPNSIEQW